MTANLNVFIVEKHTGFSKNRC